MRSIRDLVWYIEGDVISARCVWLNKGIERCDSVIESLGDKDRAVADCDLYIEDGCSCLGIQILEPSRGVHHVVD